MNKSDITKSLMAHVNEISEILEKGNDVEIRTSKEGVRVIEVKKVVRVYG